MRAKEVMALALDMGAVEEDSQILLPLCQAAVTELTLRLKKGLSPEDCGDAFNIAAAWLALDGMEAAGGRIESFSAGDMTVKTGVGITLRQRAELLIAPYFGEVGFAFMGVRG